MSHHSPTPHLLKGGGWDFSKMAVMGEWKYFARNGGKPGMGQGGWSCNGGDGEFLKSLWVF